MQKYIKLPSKKVILLIFSVIFILSFAINNTYAWFYSRNQIISTLVIGGFDLSTRILDEPGNVLNITSPQLIGGETIDRTLEIKNPVSSQDCYIRVKGVFEMDYGAGFVPTLDVQMQLAAGQTDWGIGKNGPEFWYYYNNPFLPDTTLTVDLVFIVFPTEGNDTIGIGNDEATKPFRITVNIEAIQADNNAYQEWTSDSPGGWPAF